MSGQMRTEQFSETEFSDLLQALSATAKGRFFLAEFLRRHRPQETRMLLDALRRIEATVELLRDQLEPERLAREMRRIAGNLDIAAEDARQGCADQGDAPLAVLLARASADLEALADSLAPIRRSRAAG